MAQDKIKSLYDTFVKEGYNMESEADFRKNLADPAKRKAAYDALVKEGYNMEAYGDFETNIGFGATAQQPTPTTEAQPTTEVASAPAEQPQSEPAQPAWQPTEQEKIAMSYQLHQTMDGFNRRSKEMIDQTRRVVERHTPEGRKKLKAAEFAAQLAGTPTKVMGLTPPTPPVSSEGEQSEDGKQSAAVRSLQSPVPYGVKIVDGKRVTEWLLPDGRLTTNLLEADQAEYVARNARLEHQFVSRMKRNGLNVAKQEDVSTQIAIDAIQTGNSDGRVDAEAYQQVLDYMGAMGLDRRNPTHVKWTVTGDERSVLEYQLRKTEARVKKLNAEKAQWLNDHPGHYTNGSYMGGPGSVNRTYQGGTYVSGTPYPNSAELQRETDLMVAQEAALRKYDQANKAKGKGWFGKVTQGLLDGITDPNTWTMGVYDMSGAEGLRNNGIASLGAIRLRQATPDAGGWYNGGRFAGEMVGDPITYASLGAGSLAGKLTRKAAVGVATNTAMKGIEKQVAERLLTRQLGYRMLQGSMNMGANLATFEGMRDARQQMMDGGWYDDEGNFHEGFSLNHSLKQGGHGFILGSVMGGFGVGWGNVGNWATKQVSSVGGKAAVRSSQYLGGAVFEGTIFAVEDIYNFHTMDDDKFDKLYAKRFGYDKETDKAKRDAAREEARSSMAWNAWGESQAMIFGMKMSGKATHPMHTIRDVKSVLTELRGKDTREHRSFSERLKANLDRSPLDINLTDDEVAELRSKGYGKLADLYRMDEAPTLEDGTKAEFGRIQYGEMQTGPNDGRILGEREGEVTGFERTTFDGYSALEQLMQDGKVSQTTRAKAYYLLTGNMLPVATVAGCSVMRGEDGSITVNATTHDGEVITTRKFTSEAKAEAYKDAVMRQAELNSIDVGEQFREAEADKKIFEAAVQEAYPGADLRTVEDIYNRVKNGDKSVTDAMREQVAKIDEAMERNANAGDEYRPEAMRNEIKEETGIDVDEVLKKQDKERTPEEKAALQTYAERLFPEEARQKAQEEAEAYAQSQPTPEQSEALTIYNASRETYSRFDEGTPEEQAEARADMDAISLRYKEALELIDDAFGAEAEMRLAEMQENPWDLVTNPELTADQQDAVLYYINARAALDGVQDAANESADRKRDAVVQAVEARTHVDAGVVIPATMKVDDRQVFIVKGNVVMFEDGTAVDVRNSDNSVVVFDPATGQREFTSPDRIFKVGEAVDPQAEIDSALAEVEAQRKVFPDVEEKDTNSGENISQNSAENFPTANVEEYDRGYEDAIEEAKNLSDERVDHYVDVLREGAQKQMQETGRVDDYIRGRLEALEFVQQDRAGQTVPKTEEIVPKNEESVINGQQTALQRIPVDEKSGEPMFESVDKDTAWDGLVEAVGSDKDALEIGMAQIQQASADLEALKKKPPTPKTPKLKGSPMAMAQAKREANEAHQRAMTEYQQQLAEAEARQKAWNAIVGVYTSRNAELRRQQDEEMQRRQAEAHDAAVARFEEEQRIKAEKQAEQDAIGTHAVNPKIKARWDAAPKVEGNSDAITLPDGSTIRGRYVLTEAGAASASHDVNNAYAPTEGFPIDENGQSVNDRDYERDKDAQRIVEQMAGAFDNRALQSPIIVSKDGVVLSGNNRTMSGDLAARQGTDKAYIDYVKEFGGKYGFTPEQMQGMRNPRIVFVPDEALPYDATTFSRFNAPEMKSQSKPEAAVKLGKTVPDDVFADIARSIARYDRLSDFYADERAAAQALGALQQAGIINDKQMPEMRTGTALSAAGKELIENTLIGKVFQTSPDAVREIISSPTLRQSVIMGLNEIAGNRTLSKQGYDLSKELADAVDLVFRAKAALPDVFVEGVPVSPFGRQQGLFDDEFGDSRVTDGVTLLLADILNSGKPSDLRKILTSYNNEASSSASGQIDMFSGSIPTKEEILTTINEHFRNATPKEQQALVDAAIAERKRRAEAESAEREQRGRDEAGEQTADALQRGSETQQPTGTELEPLGKDPLDPHEDTPEEAALRARISVGEEWEEESDQPGKPVYKRKLYIDGKHEIVQTDAPNENGSYTGSRLTYNGKDYGDLMSIAQAVDGATAEPTEAQKRAGNYKMEHRRIDGYEISIENPKGSVRRGKDANGKEWESTMHNDYGYIRGTEGVDGDHIDVFLSDNPEEGNVYVVDQYHAYPSMEFDEHKVMYGFADGKAALDAYLANYDEGWEQTRRLDVTGVSKDEFKKWVKSSKRKTKPFAEYKSVTPIEGNGVVGRSLTAEEATALISRMEELAVEAPQIELTPENWIAQFGEDGRVATPLGEVKLGENQFIKLFSRKRTEYFGMMYPTLNSPDVVIEKKAPAEGAERDTKLLFVKTFVKPNGGRIVHFESITVQRDGMEVSVSSHEAEAKDIKKDMQNEKILHISERLSPDSDWSLTGTPTKPEGPDLVPTSDKISSDGKDNTLSSDKQTSDAESSQSALSASPQQQADKSDVAFGSHDNSKGYTITPAVYVAKKVRKGEKEPKKTPMHRLVFDRELGKEEEAAIKKFASEKTGEGRFAPARGWKDRENEGWLFRTEEDARKAAEMIGNEEAVADNQPLSREDIREAVAPASEPASKPKPGNMATIEDLSTGAKTFGNAVDLLPSYGWHVGEVYSNGKESFVVVGGKSTKRDGFQVIVRWNGSSRNDSKPSYMLKQYIEKHSMTRQGSDAKAPINRVDVEGLIGDLKGASIVSAISGGAPVDVSLSDHATPVEDKGHELINKAIGKTFRSEGGNTMKILSYEGEGVYRVEYNGKRNVQTVESLLPWLNDTEVKPTEGKRTLNITDAMKADEDILRDILGIDDAEVGDVHFRDTDSLTPEQKRKVYAVGVNYSLGYFDQGIVSFPDFAKAMVGRLGEKIKPWLKSFYEGAKRIPGYDESMFTPTEEVDRFDVANFDKPSADVMKQAEMIVAERKAREATAQAEKEITETRNQKRKEHDKQTEADTAALAEKAEAVASKAEGVAETSTDRGELNRAAEEIDDTLAEVNDQLALLGYYEADLDAPESEIYGLRRSAEKKAVKDATKLATQLIADLGIDLAQATTTTTTDRKGNQKTKKKPLAASNLTGIDGDVTINLPMPDGRNLHINIGLQPTHERGVEPHRGGGAWEGDNLEVDRIMYRFDRLNGRGDDSNHFLNPDVTYAQMLADIQRTAKWGMPKQPEQSSADFVKDMAERMERGEQPYTVTPEVEAQLAEQRKAEAEAEPYDDGGYSQRHEIKEREKNGFKVGEKVWYTRADGKHTRELATIVDFGGGSDVTLDTGMAPVMYEACEWSQIEKRQPDIFDKAAEVAESAKAKREAKKSPKKSVSSQKPKQPEVKPEQPIGDLFSGLFDEPNENERQGDTNRGSQAVADGERPHPVGTDGPRTDGGLRAGETRQNDGRGNSDAVRSEEERGTDGATSATGELGGVQPSERNRGRDAQPTDGGVSVPTGRVGRDGADRPGTERRGADTGAESVSEGAVAPGTGKGGRPASVKKQERRFTKNFRYGDEGNEADNYTPSQRLEGNVAALETLADVLFGNGKPTEEQKAIMSRFRGWGQVDLAKYWNVDALIERSPYGSPLKRLAAVIKRLDPDGEKKLYEAIKRASLSAYFTPTPVARAQNTFLTLAGFRGGKLLDPSMGNGVFEGTLPKELQERTMITGVELDWLTGQLARALYPDADIRITGFQNSGFAPNTFDVVTSNVPFGDFGVNDPSWKNDKSPIKRSSQNRIHNYYAVKMLELARPGGLVSMMTTSAVMDTPSNQNVRRHIAEQGEIIGAVRIPDNTFQGTGAVADIIFVRKWRDENDMAETRSNPDYQKIERAFLETAEMSVPGKDGNKVKVTTNGYYGLFPKNMIGEAVAGNQYRADAFGLTSKMSYDEIGKEVEKAVKRIVGTRKGELFNPTKTTREVHEAVREAFKGDGDWVSNGNLVVQDGKTGTLQTSTNEYGEVTRTFIESPQHSKLKEQIADMGEVRKAMKMLVAAQINGADEKNIAILRKQLNTAYNNFVSKHGKLHDKNNAFILDDIDGYTLRALEVWKDGKFVGLSDIFTKNTIKPALKLYDAKTPQEAITSSLAEFGELRPAYMEKILGENWAEACGDMIFRDPDSEDGYVTRDEYLSGDVVSKLEKAEEAAKTDPEMERNVTALREVQPVPIPFAEISTRLGARWIPGEVYSDFVRETYGLHVSSSRRRRWVDGKMVEDMKSGISYSPDTDTFHIEFDSKELGGEAESWSTARKSAKEILQAALEDKTIVVYDTDKEGNKTLNSEQTELANEKVSELRERFETWLGENEERAEMLAALYNRMFNSTVKRKFDGSHLNVPGLMGKELRPHQKDAVWMLINNRGGIVDHIVGAGKTLVMQSAIMEMRRMGIAKKPMIVALKSTVSQIAREFKEAFPSARVLAPGDGDFSKENRKRFMANISLNDYDCVILSHEQYCMLPHSEEAERVVIDEQLAQLNAMIEYLYGTDDKSQMTKKQIKALEKRKENLLAKLAKRLDRNVDREFCFENLGVDYLFVDECHQFKSLPYVTSYQKVAGLGDAQGSNRAVALLTGIRYLQKMHQGDKGTIFLSGTTITNSLVEIYNLMNYLRPRKMEELGFTTFDAWASTFAIHSAELEAGAKGTFEPKDRFRNFANVPELSQLYAEIADVRNDSNLKLPKPSVDGNYDIVPASPAIEEINREIVNMLDNKDGSYFGIHPKDPQKYPWGLTASGLSAKASISPRLIFPDMEDEGGKIHYVCENVKKAYDEMSEHKGVQLIFCELGVPGKGKKYDAYNDIIDRLTNTYGIPRSEIAYIQEAKNDEAKEELFQKAREGRIRILIGGTKNMGTGVNVQTLITDMHFMSVPWTPAALEQCIGRGARQGNWIAEAIMGNKVRVHYYATDGTLDLYKFQLLDAKGKMFTQFKTGTTSGSRDFDEGAADEDGNIDPAELVAILSGNPIIFEKAKQEKYVKKLKNLRNGFLSDYQRKKAKFDELTSRKEKFERLIRINNGDVADLQREGFVPDDKGVYPSKVTVSDGSYFGRGMTFDKPKEAGEYILKLLKDGKKVYLQGFGKRAEIVSVNEEKAGLFAQHYEVQTGEGYNTIRYSVRLSDDATAAGTAFRSLLQRIINNKTVYANEYEGIVNQLKGMNVGDGVFPRQAELDEAVATLKQMTAEYNALGKKESNGDKTKFRVIDEGEDELLSFLNNQPLKKGYRYAQWADMGVRPPMTAKVNGEWRPPMLFSRWEQSEEGMRKANGKADLVQGNGRTTGDVAYNPYFHIRTSPLNDQFTAAYDRPELIVVEGYYPESEETSGYQAEGAKDSVGLMDWHSGSVNGQLSDATKVQTMLSRYFKPSRIVPWSEVADLIMERVGKQKITFPINAVPPMLRAELAKRGARFGDVSGQVAEGDIAMLHDLRDRVNAGEHEAGLEKAQAYLDAYESSEEAKVARAEELSQRLHTPIRLITSEDEIAQLPSARHRRAKGWATDKGEIVIVVPNNVNVADIENTAVHEIVGHDGLEAFIGPERMDEFVTEVYDHAGATIKKKIDARAEKEERADIDRMTREKQQAGEDYIFAKAEATVEAGQKRRSGHYQREATKEYMADMAGEIGDKGFEKMSQEEQTLWGKIKAKVQKFLDAFLRGLKIAKGIKLTDKDLAYILYKAWKHKRGDVFSKAEDAVMRRKSGYDADAQTRFRDGGLGLEEAITKMKAEAAQANSDNLQAKRDAMRAIGGNLNHLRQAMARQREYDLTTVKSITDLAKVLLENNLLDDLSKHEVKRILGAVNNVVGRQDVSQYVQKVMDIMVDNQLRMGANALGKLLTIKGSRVDARGIEVQGELDPEGVAIAKVVRKSTSLPKDEIDNLMADAVDRMSSTDTAIADEATIQYAGLQIARQFVENITESKAEEKLLRESIKQAKADKDAGQMDDAAYRQYVAATEDAIRQNKIERAESYHELVEMVGGVMSESIERAKAWREAEKQRVEEIHHNANSDMEGRPTDEHHKNDRLQKLSNNSGVRFLLAPLATFDQMLRMFGQKNVRGEGYLWNRYMRGWVEATEKEYTGYRDALKRLDAKVSEVYGKKMKWGDLFSIDRKLPKATVRFWDGGEMKDHELTQGNLLYIYMADKMADGRMKLRRMGITEDDIENIKNFLDPKFLELADWMQEEFLTEKRNGYNEVHKRMFGASMAAIENYFPLKILANARMEEVDVADDTTDTALPATSTGSIIKRRRNNLALDVTGANAFSVILDHLQQMERWAAFAEFNRDLNTLLSYKRFRNQVMNMSSVYGGGKTLWNNFRNVASMAAGAYRPPIAALDKAAVNIAKGVTAAKVSFRVFTALKQFLSMPTYLSDSNPLLLAKNIATPWVAWNWSMENLPIFEKRWRSRMAGDPRLLKTEMDWKAWRSNIVQLASRVGMSPNAFVDALTVAIGAHAMYETKKRKYLRWGMSEADAEKRAKQDATILFNQTQQSSEGAFLSTMQVDRSWLSVLFTVFRNSSMSYTRQQYDAIRNLARRLKPGYAGLSEEFMAKQMRRDGIDPDTADREAKREYRRGIVRDLARVAVFGFALQLAWNMGAYLPYLLLGDDDEEKDAMWDDIFNHTYFGSVEGLTGGDVMSAAGQMTLNGEGNWSNLTKDMPLAGDLANIYRKIGKDNVSAMNDVVNLLAQSTLGVNPQSLTDAVVAVIDACGDDADSQRECALLITRIINCPQSQIDKLYFDELGMSGEEASQITPQEIAERYAEYKTMRNAPLTGWAYSDEGREEQMAKHRKKATTAAKTRLEGATSTDEVKALLTEYDEVNARETELNKLKKERKFAEYREGKKQLQQEHDMRVHARVKRYKRDIKELTEKYLSPGISWAEADSIVRQIGATRDKMLEDVGRFL